MCFSLLCHSAHVQTLKDIALEFHDAGVLVLLAAPNADVEASITSSGLDDALGGTHLFVYPRVHEAVKALLLRRVTSAHLPARRIRADTQVGSSSTADGTFRVASMASGSSVHSNGRVGRWWQLPVPHWGSISFAGWAARRGTTSLASQADADDHTTDTASAV